MSYDIYATDIKGNVLDIDMETYNLRSGTYALYGTNEAYLNITFNYAKHFLRVIDKDNGIKSLNGKKVYRTINILNKAIFKLKDDVVDNYWESTEGNARKALINLMILAILVLEVDRDAIWEINY